MIYVAQIPGDIEPLMAGTSKHKIYDGVLRCCRYTKFHFSEVIIYKLPLYNYSIIEKELVNINDSIDLYREIYDLATDIQNSSAVRVEIWDSEIRKQMGLIRKANNIRGRNIRSFIFTRAFYDGFYSRPKIY